MAAVRKNALRAVEPAPSDTRWIPLRALGVDPAVNTRPVDNNWVTRHVPVFNPEAIGVLAVSERSAGVYIILDGQNRAELMRRVGWGDQSVLCRIYTGLGIGQEAALFLSLNDRRAVKAVYRFLAKLTQGDPAAVAIDAAVRAAGWAISDQSRDGHIVATVSLERIYHGDRAKNPSGANTDALTKALQTITQAWGYRAEAANGDLLHGLGMLFLRYGETIDLAVLVKKMAGFAGGPANLLGTARGLKHYAGGSTAHNVAEVLVNLYNRGRRNRTLPQWRGTRA